MTTTGPTNEESGHEENFGGGVDLEGNNKLCQK